MLVGYAQVSTLDQNPEFQIEELKKADCERIFTEKISGAKADRPKLQEALDYMRTGDTLVVWKLSRLARSLSQIMGTVKELQ
ncbi:MAG: recombinase family protein [Holosporaceae bacterium]|jgi:DNA invertase Pin-like site-specific DNA recombinase|nr:recombinase family protein [Holosporaceae bacterium]